MSTRQLIRQLEYIAKNLTWDGNNKVFFDVFASVLPWDFFIDGDIRSPYLIISITSANSNEENPELKNVTVKMDIVCRHEGDRWGRMAAIGGHGSWNQTDSKQKSIFEIQEKLWENIEKQGRDSGIIYMFSGRNEQIISGQGREGEESIAILEIEFQALIFERSVYVDAFNFKATKSGTDAILTWQDPPDRYDLIKTNGLIIARKSGSNPAITDQIATVDYGIEQYTDVNPGAGSWNYGIFVQYDEINEVPSSATNISAGKFATVVI